MRRIFCALSAVIWPAITAIPDGTSFNIQNPIPHPSQKEKVLLETRRAKECQRGIAGAAERSKEGGRVPSESSDTRLGARCREFESPHSDQVMIIRTTLSKLVMCSDLSFLLKMYYSKQRQGQFLSLPLLIFFAMMIKMGTL